MCSVLNIRISCGALPTRQLSILWMSQMMASFWGMGDAAEAAGMDLTSCRLVSLVASCHSCCNCVRGNAGIYKCTMISLPELLGGVNCIAGVADCCAVLQKSVLHFSNHIPTSGWLAGNYSPCCI